MRKIISIGLIFVLSAHGVYQLGVITYFQLNRDFIAQVLCENKEEPIPICKGSCFLEKSLDQNQESNHPAPPVPSPVEIPPCILPEAFKLSALTKTFSQNPFPYLLSTYDKHLKSIFHPPGVCNVKRDH